MNKQINECQEKGTLVLKAPISFESILLFILIIEDVKEDHSHFKL